MTIPAGLKFQPGEAENVRRPKLELLLTELRTLITILADGDKGDITLSGSGLVWTVDNNVVTFAKMADIATDRLIGRDSAGTGDPEALTVGGGIEFTGSGGIQRSALTGDVTATAGSGSTAIANDAVTYAKLQNVSATDRLLGRDSSGAGDAEELTVSGGLEFTGSGGIRLTDTITAAGPIGSSSVVPIITYDAKGRLTNVSFDTITPGAIGAAASSLTLTAGAGLTGGGDLTANRTFAVGAGTGITVNADDVQLDTSNTRNTDHGSVTLTAGDGLTGGGDITASRSFAVGAGTGITVNSDDVALDATHVSNAAHPASSTDNAVARYDSTAGAIQDSAFLVDDSGHVSSFGGNIKFPATQAASADANTLDDYEEGSWTPTLLFGGAAVSMTGTFTGRYTKIGRLVFIDLIITLTAKGSSTGSATIGGLPFTSATSPGSTGNVVAFTLTTVAVPNATVAASSTSITLRDFTGSTSVAMNDTDFNNTTIVTLSLVYSV